MCEVSFCISACSLQFVFNLGVTLASVFSMCFIIEAHTLQAQNISWFSVILLKELPKRAPDKGITVIMSTSVWACFLQWRRSGSSTHGKYPDTASSSVIAVLFGWGENLRGPRALGTCLGLCCPHSAILSVRQLFLILPDKSTALTAAVLAMWR